MNTGKLLDQLTDKLKTALGGHLVSVVLYGSAAGGDFHENFSDLNVFCVLDEVTPDTLGACEPIVRWWREKGNPAPLLMSSEEVRTSTDCFPVEFHDMSERRKVLFGQDPLVNLQIDEIFYRAQVEHELRAKLLRLRQKAAGVLSNPDLLLRLMEDSVSTFCVLLRHALKLAGQPAPSAKRETVRAAEVQFGFPTRAFDTLLDLREGKVKPRDASPGTLFRDYLLEIEAAIAAVDRLDR